MLSLFCLGLGFRTYIQTRKTKFYLNKQRAFYLAVSGVKIAQQMLEQDMQKDKEADTYVDHLGEDWSQPIEKEVAFSYPGKTGKISVEIEDETSRININTMQIKMLKKLLTEKEVENPNNKADYIIDYIDANTDTQAGEPEVEGRYKNAALSVLSELLLIEDISVDDYNKIKYFVSVVGDGKVNINTVLRETLDFLIECFFTGKTEIVNKLFGQPDGERGYYSALDWQNVMSEEISSDPDPVLYIKDIFCINSKYYRITSEGEVDGVKKKIICVLNREAESGKILYWHEN